MKEARIRICCGEENCMIDPLSSDGEAKGHGHTNEKAASEGLSAALTFTPKSHALPRRYINQRFLDIAAVSHLSCFMSEEWYELSCTTRTNFHEGESLRDEQPGAKTEKVDRQHKFLQH